MKQTKLDQMSRVTEAVYLSEFQKVKGILSDEARLRRDLAQLETQARQERQTLQDDVPMQSLGADVLWQAWLTRTQRQLNMELAQVMARKLTAMGRVRTAFGRQNAVHSMLETERKEAKKAAQKKAAERLIQTHVGK